jgi:ribosomal protein S27AE
VTNDSRFCPNCGSENVEPDFSRSSVLGEMMFNQNKWLCNDCGYTGVMPQLSQAEKDCSEQQPEGLMRPEGDPEQDFQEGEEEIEFEEVEQQEMDTGPGSAYFRYYFKILIPVTVIFFLLVLLLVSL